MPCFDDDVVYISLDEVITNLVVEALLDGPLIGGSGVFESKEHGRVAICAEGSNEGCFDLVIFL